MQKNLKKICVYQKKAVLLHPLSKKTRGAIAQLVEQRTENPCVTGSIPVGTTKKETQTSLFFCFHFLLPSSVYNPVADSIYNTPSISTNFLAAFFGDDSTFSTFSPHLRVNL